MVVVASSFDPHGKSIQRSDHCEFWTAAPRLEHNPALRGSDFTVYERHSCDGLALLSARSLATLLSFQLLIIAGPGFSGFSLLSFAFLLASLPPPLRPALVRVRHCSSCLNGCEDKRNKFRVGATAEHFWQSMT